MLRLRLRYGSVLLAALAAWAGAGIACRDGSAPSREPALPASEAGPREEPARADAELRALLDRLVDSIAVLRPPPSAAEWPARRKDLKRRLSDLLGFRSEASFGEPPPVRFEGRLERDGLVVERLVYHGAEDVAVPALLWRLKDAEGPSPGVVLLHGHLQGRKEAADIQRAAAALARGGRAVLCPDLPGFGERAFMGHGRHAFELFAAGGSHFGLAVRDVERGLALLRSLPDVAGDRLALVGHSGGGSVAAHAFALVDEVAAAAVVNALDPGPVLGRVACSCNVVPGELGLLGAPGVLALAAPRPLLVSAAEADTTFPIAEARAAFGTVAALYAGVGAAGALSFDVQPGPHELDPGQVQAVGAFLARSVGGASRSDPAAERPWSERELRRLRTADFEGGATLTELAARRQRRLHLAASSLPAASRRRLVDALGSGPAGPPELTVVADAAGGGLRRRVLRLATGDGLHLRGLLLSPLSPLSPAPVEPGTPPRLEAAWLWLDPAGAEAAVAGGGLEALALSGAAVLAVDLRGHGEHASGVDERALILLGEALGRPLLGQRLRDARDWLDTSNAWAGEAPRALHGEAEGAWLALALAGLDARVAAVSLADAPLTLLARPGEELSWGLPASLGTSVLVQVGDVADLASLSTAPKAWWRPRLRSAAPVESPEHASWRAVEAADPASLWAASSTELAGFRRRVGGRPVGGPDPPHREGAGGP